MTVTNFKFSSWLYSLLICLLTTPSSPSTGGISLAAATASTDKWRRKLLRRNEAESDAPLVGYARASGADPPEQEDPLIVDKHLKLLPHDALAGLTAPVGAPSSKMVETAAAISTSALAASRAKKANHSGAVYTPSTTVSGKPFSASAHLQSSVPQTTHSLLTLNASTTNDNSTTDNATLTGIVSNVSAASDAANDAAATLRLVQYVVGSLVCIVFMLILIQRLGDFVVARFFASKEVMHSNFHARAATASLFLPAPAPAAAHDDATLQISPSGGAEASWRMYPNRYKPFHALLHASIHREPAPSVCSSSRSNSSRQISLSDGHQGDTIDGSGLPSVAGVGDLDSNASQNNDQERTSFSAALRENASLLPLVRAHSSRLWPSFSLRAASSDDSAAAMATSQNDSRATDHGAASDADSPVFQLGRDGTGGTGGWTPPVGMAPIVFSICDENEVLTSPESTPRRNGASSSRAPPPQTSSSHDTRF